MVGGYILCDLAKEPLNALPNDSTPTTVTGLYEYLDTRLEAGKTIIAVSGRNSAGLYSISPAVIQLGRTSGRIFAQVGNYIYTVTNADLVTRTGG